MLRSKSYAKGIMTALAAATFAAPAIAGAQDTRPVVVVYMFDNSALGSGHADFDGMRTGVQDLLITEMASNVKIRLVDRAHIAEVQAEQNMVKTGQIDPQTAIKLGKIMGAQYAVTGGWMSDGKGKAVITGRTIDLETTQIGNPQKIEGKSDDVMSMISELSTKLNGNLNLAPKPGAPERRVGDAEPAAAQKSAPAQSGTPKSEPAKTQPAKSEPMKAEPAKSAPAASTKVVQYAKAQSDASRKIKPTPEVLKIYSQALDEIDKKNNAKAKDLLKQVLAKYDGWEPAQRQLAKLS